MGMFLKQMYLLKELNNIFRKFKKEQKKIDMLKKLW